MGNTQCPGKKFPLLIVVVLPKTGDDFNERFLKEVFRQFTILDQEKDGREDSLFVTSNEFGNGALIAVLIKTY